MQNGNARSAASQRQWTTRAAGLPCAIELTDDGAWIVTIASASTTRRDDLAAAIVDASGGLVSHEEARTVAAAVANSSGQRGDHPTLKREHPTTGEGR